MLPPMCSCATSRTHTTTLVSRATGTPARTAMAHSFAPTISSDGATVAFTSTSTNLDPADGDEKGDVYVRVLTSGTTTLASRLTGFAGAKGNGESFFTAISGDGSAVAFCSMSANLDPASDTGTDVFVRDRVAGTTAFVSRATGTAGLKSHSTHSTLSADARYVAFESFTSRLDPVDADFAGDVFVRDRQAGSTMLVSRATGQAGAKGNRAQGLRRSPATGATWRSGRLVRTSTPPTPTPCRTSSCATSKLPRRRS